MRQQLVDTLIEKGIKDKAVLNAIGKIPRHLFMDSGFIDHAYVDKAFPIAADQTISQPYTVAFQSELLQINFPPDINSFDLANKIDSQSLIAWSSNNFRSKELAPIICT